MQNVPIFAAALTELQTILAARSNKENITAEIPGEIELREEDKAMRSVCLRLLVGKIQAAE